MKCYICLNEINNWDSKHIHRCDKSTISKSEKRLKLIIHNCNNKEDISFDFLNQKYLNEFWSIKDISDYLRIKPTQTVFLLEFFDIPQRTIKDIRTPRFEEKVKETNILLFGVENVSQSEDIKDKKRKTFIENYGVDNIFATEEFKKYLPIIMHERYGVGSLPNRYGNFQKWWDAKDREYRTMTGKILREGWNKWWNNLSEEEKDLQIQKRCAGLVASYNSGIEKRIEDMLSLLNIFHSRQKWIKNKSYDFLLTGTNILIEVQGDYWHANPKTYIENDLIPGMDVLAKDIWQKDIEKKTIAERYGYVVIEIWEDDIRSRNDYDLSSFLLDKIKEKTNASSNKINKTS